MPDEREIGNRVKGGIIGIIRGTGEIAQATIETVTDTAQAAVKGAGATGAAVGGLAVGAVKGAIEGCAERRSRGSSGCYPGAAERTSWSTRYPL
jgi:hypothetical protein